jgi:hypothetical protein
MQLAEVGGALYGLRLIPRPAEGGEENPDKHRDDADHHQQFNQREPATEQTSHGDFLQGSGPFLDLTTDVNFTCDPDRFPIPVNRPMITSSKSTSVSGVRVENHVADLNSSFSFFRHRARGYHP